MNQSTDEANVKARLNADLIPFSEDREYRVRVWVNNKPAATQKMKGGVLTVKLPPHGITGVCIEGISVTPQFQQEVFGPGGAVPDPGVITQDGPFGDVIGMTIDMGPSLKEAYVYLQATEKELKQATLSYKVGDKWESVTDNSYPFEFSMPISGDPKEFEYKVEGVGLDGKVETSRVSQLNIQ